MGVLERQKCLTRDQIDKRERLYRAAILGGFSLSKVLEDENVSIGKHVDNQDQDLWPSTCSICAQLCCIEEIASSLSLDFDARKDHCQRVRQMSCSANLSKLLLMQCICSAGSCNFNGIDHKHENATSATYTCGAR